MLDEGRRLEILAALGVDVYVLRVASPRIAAREAKTDPAPSARDAEGESAPAAVSAPRLVVACPPGTRRELQARCVQLVRALGLAQHDAAFLSAGSVVAPQVPEAPAYLMLGAEAARACSAQLPLERQQGATIAIADDAWLLASDAAAKRALWSALKPLAWRLRGGVV